MSSFNQVTLMGNLTRDPELTVTQGGASVCKFGLAVNEVWKDDNGAKREDTCFVDITAWGSTGENAAKYLQKGSQVLIAGKLKFDQWEDKQSGQKRSKLSVVAQRVTFVGAPKNGGNQQQGGGEYEDHGDSAPRYSAPPPRQNNGGGQQGQQRRNSPPPQEHIDDDVPF